MDLDDTNTISFLRIHIVMSSDQMPFQIIFATEMSGADGTRKHWFGYQVNGSVVSSGCSYRSKKRAALQTLDFAICSTKLCQVGIDVQASILTAAAEAAAAKAADAVQAATEAARVAAQAQASESTASSRTTICLE